METIHASLAPRVAVLESEDVKSCLDGPNALHDFSALMRPFEESVQNGERAAQNVTLYEHPRSSTDPLSCAALPFSERFDRAAREAAVHRLSGPLRLYARFPAFVG